MKLKTNILLVGGLVIAVAIGVGFGVTTSREKEQVATTSQATKLDYYVIPESDKNKVDGKTSGLLTKASEALDKIYKDNGVLKVIVGAGEDGEIGTDDDNYIVQMYNEQGQCYSEANNNLVSFYYDRGKSVMFSTKVEETADVTILDLVRGALNLCEAGVKGCTVEVTTQEVPTEETENVKVDVDNTGADGTDGQVASITEHLITLKITGLNNIEKVYSQYSLKQGEDIRKSWLGIYGVPEELDETTATNSEAQGLTKQELDDKTAKDSMTLSIYLTDTGDLSVSSNLNINSQEYTSWVFDGYTPLKQSWTAGEGWKSSLSDEEYLDLISKVQNNISDSMKDWESQQKGTEETESVSIPESAENSTEESSSGGN